MNNMQFTVPLPHHTNTSSYTTMLLYHSQKHYRMSQTVSHLLNCTAFTNSSQAASLYWYIGTMYISPTAAKSPKLLMLIMQLSIHMMVHYNVMTPFHVHVLVS